MAARQWAGAELGITGASWAKIEPKTSDGCADEMPTEVEDMASQLRSLKRRYDVFKAMKSHPFFLWCPLSGVALASEMVWADFLAVYPDAEEFRLHPLSFYDELREIFDGPSVGKVAQDSTMTSQTPIAARPPVEAGEAAADSDVNTQDQLVALLKSHTDAIATCVALQEAIARRVDAQDARMQQLTATQETIAEELRRLSGKLETGERSP